MKGFWSEHLDGSTKVGWALQSSTVPGSWFTPNKFWGERKGTVGLGAGEGSVPLEGEAGTPWERVRERMR